MSDETVPDVAGLAEELVGLLKAVAPAAAKRLSREQAEQVVGELLQDSATERWMSEQIAQIGVRAMEYRNGAVSMDLEPARDLVAIWVGACRGLIGAGPNYSETVLTDNLAHTGDKIKMGVKVAESPDKYVITVQRDAFDAITPHQARLNAEKKLADLVRVVWKHIADVNDGAGFDVDDLGFAISQMGYLPPPDID